jgi:two-component system, chemotaxis family, protein-glutamate methylesterase/glutaminase
MKYKAIVIGVSSGGLNALKMLVPALPAGFAQPVIIVQHVGPHSDAVWVEILNSMSAINVKEADEKEKIEKGNVYVAPPNYHLLVEKDHTFSLSTEQKVNFARPSIDVLFESAAEAYQETLIGITLTGANQDGAAGMKKIGEYGGLTIVEDPATAETPYMPASVIRVMTPDHILPLEKIINLLTKLSNTFST